MYKTFNSLLDKKGVRASDVARATKIPPSTFSDWKNGKSIPKAEKLQKLAEYFEVPVTYFLDDTILEANTTELNKRDERDIAKRMDQILNTLDQSEALMFDGDTLDEETRELLKISLENSIRIAKINAKQKYTPKKYKK